MDFAHLSPPTPSLSAWLDMDALDANITLVNQKTASVNLRLATKSIRSIDVLNYIIDKSPNYIGLMSYSAAESAYLLAHGFDNILCAYPTLDKLAIIKTLEYTKDGAVMIWMVDCIEQWQLLDDIAAQHHTHIKICLDINMSMRLPKLYFGTKRSTLMQKKQVKTLLQQAKNLKHTQVVALMGYEAQIAGLAETSPNNPKLALAIRLLKQRSCKQVTKRRRAMTKLIKSQGIELEIVNGGGSGSMDFTCQQSEITEITVGSAYYKPAYFDYMDSMQAFKPAAGFLLPVTRQPEDGVITCQSGGFIASGALGIDKQPVVIYPKNLAILPDEGFGEVQTPMQILNKKLNTNKLNIGDFVWCRHAKAGELCEHFNQLYCYRGDQVLTKQGKPLTMITYRGDGQCFH